jgi:hypothetical protein
MFQIRKQSLFLILISGLFFSCSKDKEEQFIISEAPKNVYLGGYEEGGFGGNTSLKAMYWKNGVATILPNGDRTSSIFVKGNDIYLAGALNYLSAKYWKNGIEKTLNPPTSQTYVNSIVVVNEDVYVCGTSISSGSMSKVTYWKNGEPTYLTDGVNNAGANSMTIVNGDIYVLGYETVTTPDLIYQQKKYWKNGVPKNITNEAGSSGLIDATSIFVSNNGDIYIIGNNQGVFKCWKNGVSETNYINARSFNAVDVVNNDVYIVGSKYNFTAGKTQPAYWKNDVATYITDGAIDATANSIKVIGSDIYIGGYGRNEEGIMVSKYWKNGIANNVSDKTTQTKSNSIFVTD